MYTTEEIPRGKGRRSPITTILIISLVLGGAVFLLNRVITASANSTDYSLALGTYPQIVGSRIGNCQFCHTSSIPNLNPYGSAYKALGRGNANSLIMIENLDSDGDGFTNIQEINALTYPGDSSDFPQPPTNTPTAIPPTPTNTSVPPTATNTSVPPTNTSVPPTATSVPPTNTSVPPTATNTSIPPTATIPGYPPPATATATETATVTETPIVVTPIGATMEATKTKETEEVEETEKPEKTKAATKTPKPTKTMSPSKTPKATKVKPTRIPTMACVVDYDSRQQSRSIAIGSTYDGRNCPDGYHMLGSQMGDYTKYHLKPAFSIYTRRIR